MSVFENRVLTKTIGNSALSLTVSGGVGTINAADCILIDPGFMTQGVRITGLTIVSPVASMVTNPTLTGTNISNVLRVNINLVGVEGYEVAIPALNYFQAFEIPFVYSGSGGIRIATLGNVKEAVAGSVPDGNYPLYLVVQYESAQVF